jgi:hypothetical protein
MATTGCKLFGKSEDHEIRKRSKEKSIGTESSPKRSHFVLIKKTEIMGKILNNNVYICYLVRFNPISFSLVAQPKKN